MGAPIGNNFALGNNGGRPNTYDFNLCIEICAGVANGLNIKTVLASKPEYPTFQTWCNWKRDHNELFDLYIKSIHDKAESVDEDIDSIMIDAREGRMEASIANVLIQTLKWKAAKYYPKMFGEKTDITTNGKDLPGNTIDTSKLSLSTLEELVKASKDI